MTRRITGLALVLLVARAAASEPPPPLAVRKDGLRPGWFFVGVGPDGNREIPIEVEVRIEGAAARTFRSPEPRAFDLCRMIRDAGWSTTAAPLLLTVKRGTAQFQGRLSYDGKLCASGAPAPERPSRSSNLPRLEIPAPLQTEETPVIAAAVEPPPTPSPTKAAPAAARPTASAAQAEPATTMKPAEVATPTASRERVVARTPVAEATPSTAPAAAGSGSKRTTPTPQSALVIQEAVPTAKPTPGSPTPTAPSPVATAQAAAPRVAATPNAATPSAATPSATNPSAEKPSAATPIAPGVVTAQPANLSLGETSSSSQAIGAAARGLTRANLKKLGVWIYGDKKNRTEEYQFELTFSSPVNVEGIEDATIVSATVSMNGFTGTLFDKGTQNLLDPMDTPASTTVVRFSVPKGLAITNPAVNHMVYMTVRIGDAVFEGSAPVKRLKSR
ncbi:MAG: hypothetical protein ABIT01_18210 [Thermoanaerobaculia bacterium]